MDFALSLWLFPFLLHPAETDLFEPLPGVRDDLYVEPSLLPYLRVPDDGVLFELHEYDS